MHTEFFFLVGAGGHGLVVLDALLAGEGPIPSIRLTDDNELRLGVELLGHTVVALRLTEAAGARFHVSIGNNAARRDLSVKLRDAGGRQATIIHPRACVSPFATIGTGSFIAANATVGPSASVGEGAIVNHSAVVDHECTIGAYTHIAPGAILGGGAHIGEGAFVGAGARVLPGVKVEAQALIGAGAVVLRDIARGGVYAGVPARSLR